MSTAADQRALSLFMITTLCQDIPDPFFSILIGGIPIPLYHTLCTGVIPLILGECVSLKLLAHVFCKVPASWASALPHTARSGTRSAASPSHTCLTEGEHCSDRKSALITNMRSTSAGSGLAVTKLPHTNALPARVRIARRRYRCKCPPRPPSLARCESRPRLAPEDAPWRVERCPGASRHPSLAGDASANRLTCC